MPTGPARGAGRTRSLTLATALLAGALALAWLGSGSAPAEDLAQSSRPNLIVIQLDDATTGMISARTMPNAFKRVAGSGGTRFSDYMVTAPVCCPSRASLITGEYPHNTGVLDNRPGYRDLISPHNILPAWLQHAGYNTAHVGKFLNGSFEGHPSPAPPEWDRLAVALEPHRYYDYEVQIGHKVKSYGSSRRDYLTTVLNHEATNDVRKFARKSAPFFLELDQYAPHTGAGGSGHCKHAAVPAPGDQHRYSNTPLPKPPSYNEADMSDKPSFMQLYGKFGHRVASAMRDRYRCALASLREVDRGIGHIYKVLRKRGEAGNTVLALISDNGYFFGEHRIPQGKEIPYEEIMNMPFLINVPGRYLPGQSVGQVHDVAANIDIAPTFLDLANADPCPGHGGKCRIMDGRSLVDLIGGDDSGWPSNRGVALEFDLTRDRRTPTRPCKFEGIRTKGDSYVEYRQLPDKSSPHSCQSSDEAELYDLGADPFQLENLDGSGGRPEQQLADRLTALDSCRGIQGRDPAPPVDRAYCE
jgi:N-acetylglucosamine-6-sulfatase